jgi:hypothetical protein
MERLSSCYFCGDAVDASVAEYSLVKSERYDIDTDHRIVLCPTCRRKLTDVIERVVSAVFDDDRDPEAVAAGPEDDPMTATDVQAVEADDGLDAAADPLVDVDGTENGATEVEDEGESEDAVADGETAPESAVAEGGAEAATVGSEGDDESDDDGWAGEADEDDEGATDDETAVGAAAGVEAEAADDEGAAEEDGSAETADEAETTDYEKAEFNKIVRLLQNREFPVEIDELVVVASSAYGIDEPTCHAVIRALVDRGVVEDRGDELVRA